MSAVALALAAHVQAVCPGTRATVLDLGVAPVDLPDAEWTVEGNPCREAPLLRLVGRVEGAVVRSFTVRPHLALERRGWVVGQAVAAGDPVEVEEGWVAWDTPPLQPARRMRARRDLVAGAAVGPFDVETVPDALRGDPVQLVVQRGALVLRVEGRLLADASTAEQTRAVNPATGAVLTGVLVDPGTVEIR
ncbi:MAG: flagella basal body P-ring formation protein FlgA [Myxococcales bacterium]|nr:flagella basal body P-ring formation protein FlgA [Myxococcales bacterium]MCB9672346.1 flagella basal body P-ring formation protein FlgA [Alphaproteobacteria bacterium]